MDIEEDIKIVKEFNEKNRFRDCGRLNNAINHVLAEREEDKKKIAELEVLEDDLKDKRIVYVDTPEFAENYIPKQKVKDNFNKLNTRIKDFKNPEIKKYFSIEQIIYLLEQFENKLLEDK